MSSEKRPQPQVKQEPDAGKRIKVEASSSALPAAEGSVGAAGEQSSSQQPAVASLTTASTSQPAATSTAATVAARLPGLLILSAEDVQRCLARMSAQDICKGQEDVFLKIWQLTQDRHLIEDCKRNGWDSMVEHETPPLQRSTAACQNPQRLTMDMKDHTALFMPARLGEQTACKIVGVPKPAETTAAGGGGAVAEAGIPGSTVLLDPLTAKVKAIVDSTVLTALRTAAGSAIATRHTHPVDSLERKEALHLVIFGGGRQAFYHAWMLQRVYQLPKRPKLPQIGYITFVTRKPLAQTALPQLARETQEGQPRAGDPDGMVRIGDIVAEGVTSSDETAVARLVGQANIVCCCTPSTKPLFRFADLKKGAHVNLVGSYKPHMQEVEPELILSAARAGRLHVDSYDACEHEAGDLIKAGITKLNMEDSFNKGIFELGRALPPAWETRPRQRDRRDAVDNLPRVAVFKSVGVGAQDVRIAEDIYREAIREGQPLIGTQVPY